MSFLYRAGIFVVAIAALGVAAYGFTLSFGEGARALIFFFIPALWGAYVLAMNDGQPISARTNDRDDREFPFDRRRTGSSGRCVHRLAGIDYESRIGCDGRVLLPN